MHTHVFLFVLSIVVFPLIVVAHEINPRVIERITGETIVYDHHTTPEEAPADPDPRVASRRFYTLPEWHIVYTAIEYGQFVARGRQPSQFPYFQNTKQLWELWRLAEGAAGESPDDTTNTVLYTIAVSTSIEQTLIGGYEATVGRLFEWLDFGLTTPEDVYTAAVAKEYGDFLLHTPWYQFPYNTKIVGLWSTWGWSSLTPRGIERRLIYTIGYGIKALYATAISYASSQEFSGGAALVTEVTVRGDESVLGSLPFAKIEPPRVASTVLVLPRYRAFLPAVTQLGAYKIDIESIMGHDKITFTVVKPTVLSCASIAAYEVFSLPILTDQSLHRVVYDVPVTLLLPSLKDAMACGYSVEHIYDF